MSVNGIVEFPATGRVGAELVRIFLNSATSLKEIHRLPPPVVLWHRKSGCDVASESIKASLYDFRVARVQHIVIISPVLRALENVGLALAVAACEHSVDGRGDAPHLSDPTSRTRDSVSVQNPEVVPSEDHHCPVTERSESADGPPAAQICVIAVVSLVLCLHTQTIQHRFMF